MRHSRARRWLTGFLQGMVLIGLGAAGCWWVLSRASETTAKPDLDVLYSRAARHDSGDRNPVIVIPGFLGSKLEDQQSERIVWGAFGGDAVDPRNATDAAILAFPMKPGVPLVNLNDRVQSTGVLDSLQISVAGLTTEQKAYLNILRMLGAGGYRDEQLGKFAVNYGDRHFTCFQFGYDWRKDIPTIAPELHEFIESAAEYVHEARLKRFGVDRPVKFDIVAHSMGGLIARYYLRHGTTPLEEAAEADVPSWQGAERVERTILVGTPNAGSAKSARALIEGVKL